MQACVEHDWRLKNVLTSQMDFKQLSIHVCLNHFPFVDFKATLESKEIKDIYCVAVFSPKLKLKKEVAQLGDLVCFSWK